MRFQLKFERKKLKHGDGRRNCGGGFGDGESRLFRPATHKIC
jgi:hypothetical protein